MKSIFNIIYEENKKDKKLDDLFEYLKENNFVIRKTDRKTLLIYECFYIGRQSAEMSMKEILEYMNNYFKYNHPFLFKTHVEKQLKTLFDKEEYGNTYDNLNDLGLL